MKNIIPTLEALIYNTMTKSQEEDFRWAIITAWIDIQGMYVHYDKMARYLPTAKLEESYVPIFKLEGLELEADTITNTLYLTITI